MSKWVKQKRTSVMNVSKKAVKTLKMTNAQDVPPHQPEKILISGCWPISWIMSWLFFPVLTMWMAWKRNSFQSCWNFAQNHRLEAGKRAFNQRKFSSDAPDSIFARRGGVWPWGEAGLEHILARHSFFLSAVWCKLEIPSEPRLLRVFTWSF